VECSYLNEAKFEKNDFSRGELIKIERPSGDFEGIEKFAIDFSMGETVVVGISTK
jgi:hypothetical protein